MRPEASDPTSKRSMRASASACVPPGGEAAQDARAGDHLPKGVVPQRGQPPGVVARGVWHDVVRAHHVVPEQADGVDVADELEGVLGPVGELVDVDEQRVHLPRRARVARSDPLVVPARALGGLGWSVSPLSTPLVMGWLADRYGIVHGFYAIGLFALACAAAIARMRHWAFRRR